MGTEKLDNVGEPGNGAGSSIVFVSEEGMGGTGGGGVPFCIMDGRGKPPRREREVTVRSSSFSPNPNSSLEEDESQRALLPLGAYGFPSSKSSSQFSASGIDGRFRRDRCDRGDD